jgi:hypothetical protein
MGISATIRYLKFLVNTLMKINEITQVNLQALKESLEKSNTTGVSTDNLMAIAEQHVNGTWGKAMTLEESLAEDQRILAEALGK